MNESITVIYEGGVLRPLQPLALPEHSRLEVRVIGRRQTSDQRQVTFDALQSAGVIGAQPPTDDLPAIPESQLALAARALSLAGSLSGLIIAEREGR